MRIFLFYMLFIIGHRMCALLLNKTREYTQDREANENHFLTIFNLHRNCGVYLYFMEHFNHLARIC